jgi:hypothetical protein
MITSKHADHGSSASPAIYGEVSETKPRPGAAGPAQTCGEEAPPLQGGVTHKGNSGGQVGVSCGFQDDPKLVEYPGWRALQERLMPRRHAK